MTLTVQQASLLMSIQDGGRFGYQRFGMPESGPMDWWAFRAANRLVGNDPGAACVEAGFSDAEIWIEQRSLLAVAGAGYQIFVNGRELPLWMAFIAKPGDRVRFQKVSGGNWVYLAVSGGIQSKVWMGSRSTFQAAGLGKKLAKGDQLPISVKAGEQAALAGHAFPQAKRPAYAQDISLRVISGPHQARFTETSRAKFCRSSYTVSTQSDRMGYRLVGEPLMHVNGADLVSQGMALGEIQVPGDGQPIVMMPEHPTTGGYTCIGTVARVDLPLLAQLEPGRGTLHFEPCEILEAQSAWGAAFEKIDSAARFQEDLWLGL
jgi:antagonist of KipI